MLTSTTARIEQVQQRLREARVDFLLLPTSADFVWITGAHTRSTERLLSLVVPAGGAAFCVVPRLEVDALAAEAPWLECLAWEDHEDAFALLAARIGLERRPALAIGEGFRTAPLLRLASAADCQPAQPLIGALRATKSADELAHLAEAGRHADQIVMEAGEQLRPGRSERDIARFVFERFEALGDTAPWAIIASGPNGALPHHETSDRRIADGDVVVVDLGAYTAGYASDITRTFWVGTPPPEAERVYDIVNAARQAGIDAVRAGVPAEAVDRAARAVIEAAGYGPQFTHRTGHGVGLEIHEPPYLVAGNTLPLAAGMTHSVEPGIYLPGRFGIRLEDIVAVESGGARRLNQAPFAPSPARVRG